MTVKNDGWQELYRNTAMQSVLGETLRPGGFTLTAQAMTYCALEKGAKVLDVGCGNGASVNFLRHVYGLEAMGIDESLPMLTSEGGLLSGDQLPAYLILGRAENMPFSDNSMAAVMSECTMPHFKEVGQVFQEFRRVLEPGGWLILSSLYLCPKKAAQAANNPTNPDNPSNTSNPSNLSNTRNPGNLNNPSYLSDSSDPDNTDKRANPLMTKEQLLALFEGYGFQLKLWEDHSDLLTQLLCDLIMKEGSLKELKAECQNSDLNWLFSTCPEGYKLGYYLLIAQKGEGSGT